MNNLPIGMPGPGGSLGKCQVCGDSFIGDVLLGQSVVTGRVSGIDEAITVHTQCSKLLDGRPWKDLPDGPIRRAFEEATGEEVPL